MKILKAICPKTKKKMSLGKIFALYSITFVVFGMMPQFVISQDNIGIGTTSPDNSAALHITFSNPLVPKGLLIPKLTTTERNSITSPANGLMIYNTTTNAIEYNSGTSGAPVWAVLFSSGNLTLADGNIFVGNASGQAVGVTPSGDVTITNTGVTTIGTGAVTSAKIADGTIAAGDIATSAVTTTQILDATIVVGDLASNSVDGTKITISSEATGSIMYYNGTDWVNLGIGTNGQQLKVTAGVPAWATDNSLSTTLTNGQIFVGNGSNIATGVTPTGDVTMTNAGVTTISADAVTSAKILDGTIAAGDLATNSVTNTKIQDNAVTSAKIADGAIGTGDMADAIITTGKIVNDAVTGTKLFINSEASGSLMYNNGTDWVNLGIGSNNQQLKVVSGLPAWATDNSLSTTLTNGQIFVGNGSNVATGVTPSGDFTMTNAGVSTIANNAITEAKMADNSVNTAELIDGSVINSKMAANSVNTSEIIDGAVNSGDLASNAVTTEKITDANVTLAKLAADAVNSSKIIDGTIATGDLANNSIDGTKISITSEATGSLMYYNGTSQNWENLGIGSNNQQLKVVSGLPAWATDNSLSTTLTNGQIFVGNGSNVATGVTPSGDFTMTNAGLATIANNAVTTGKIADGTIATGDIADGAVTGVKLENSGVAANSYGSATQVPVVTVDAKGRITGVTNTTITGTSPIGSALTSGNIIVGSGTNLAAAVAMSGDVTISNTGATTIATDAVTTGKILDGTIATGDLADANVTLAKLAGDAVNSSKIQDGTVAQADLATGSVNSDKIVDGTIVVGDIADGAVTTGKILDGTIANADINAAAEIDVTKLGNGTNNQLIRTNGTNVEWFTPTYLETAAALGGDLSGTIDNAQIVAGSVGATELGADAVTNAKIADNAVNTTELVDGAVTSAKITDGTIVVGDIADGAVTTGKILDGTIANADINAAAEIDVTKLGNGTNNQLIRTNGTNVEWFTPTYLETAAALGGDLSGTIDNAQIVAGTVGATELGADAVTNAKIADNAVNTAELVDGAVTSAKITDGTIVVGDIADGAVTTGKILDGTIANADINAAAEIDVTKLGNGTNNQLIRTNGTNVEWFTPTYLETAAALGGDLSGTIDNAQIVAGSVGATELGADAVTNAKIADNAVNTAELVDGAVTSAKITDGTIVVGDIADGAVTTGKILDGTIANADINAAAEIDVTKLGNGTDNQLIRSIGNNVEWFTPTFATSSTAVGGDLTGTIANAQIAADAVTSAEIADNAVGNSELIDNAVNTAEITDGAVTDNKIATDAVTTNKILNLNVTSGKIADDAITSAKLADDAVLRINIVDNAINSAKIENGTILSEDLAGSIAANKLTLADGEIYVGNVSNQAVSVALTGDADITNTGALTVSAIQGIDISTTDPTANQVLAYNSTSSSWEPKTIVSSIVRAFRNSALTVNNNTLTQISFDTETHDINSDFASGTFTAPRAGYYVVNSRIRVDFTNGGINSSRFGQIMIYKEGTLYSYGNRFTVIDSGSDEFMDNEGFVVNDIVFLNQNETVDIRFEQNSGLNVQIVTGSAETYVSIHLLSE